jgi:hypothetical protein
VEKQPDSGSYFTMKGRHLTRLALAALADMPVVFMQAASSRENDAALSLRRDGSDT